MALIDGEPHLMMRHVALTCIVSAANGIYDTFLTVYTTMSAFCQAEFLFRRFTPMVV